MADGVTKQAVAARVAGAVEVVHLLLLFLLLLVHILLLLPLFTSHHLLISQRWKLHYHQTPQCLKLQLRFGLGESRAAGIIHVLFENCNQHLVQLF